MKLHRFYITEDIELKHDVWLHAENLIHQWKRVLRFKPGKKLVLFDGSQTERLYELKELSDHEAHLVLITDMVPQKPKNDIYLLWSILKNDKNDWVLQKGTELGVKHFIPLLADRSEKTGFNVQRAKKIVIEAIEQCGRSDIPDVRDPLRVETAVKQLKDKVPLLICEQGTENIDQKFGEAAILIGPEGGWSDREKQLFEDNELQHLALNDFTLRAETACIVAVSKLLQ